jgi:hypothetical protein
MEILDALKVLANLKDREELFIALTPPFSASLETDRSVLKETLSELEVDDEEFRRAANRIGIILVNLLNNSLDLDDVSQVSQQLGIDSTSGTVPDILKDVRAVQTQLVDSALRRRYDLKRSSKAPSFSHVDWDIKVKYHDASLEPFDPVPYATFRISFQREFEDSAFAVLGGRTFDSVQVNFSKDEIDYIGRVFVAARERLAELENRI